MISKIDFIYFCNLSYLFDFIFSILILVYGLQYMDDLYINYKMNIILYFKHILYIYI